MKKIYLALALMTFAVSSFAQKSMRFQVTLQSPADGATITAGTPFTQEFIVKNMGPDALEAADSLAYQDPASGSSVWVRPGVILAAGDSIQLDNSYSFPATITDGTYSYCVVAIPLNRTNPIMFDTTGFMDCHSVTVTGGTGGTGIGELIAVKAEKSEPLRVTPNPANALINFDYIAKESSDVTARVYDLSGRTVLSYSYGKAYAGQKGFQLDISTLNTGMYFVEIRQEGYKAVGKLTKQ